MHPHLVRLRKPDVDQRHETRICESCGRSFGWRRRWAKSWPQVRYCSERCKRNRRLPDSTVLESAICELLAARKGGSICPSEAARRVSEAKWRELMRDTRDAGRRLAARRVVVVKQGGVPVDPATAKGPVRYARGPRFNQRNVGDTDQST